MTEKDFLSRQSEFAKEGRKVLAIIFNCKDYKDFRIKYFGE